MSSALSAAEQPVHCFGLPAPRSPISPYFKVAFFASLTKCFIVAGRRERKAYRFCVRAKLRTSESLASARGTHQFLYLLPAGRSVGCCGALRFDALIGVVFAKQRRSKRKPSETKKPEGARPGEHAHTNEDGRTS